MNEGQRSLYRQRKGYYSLTPGYDMISTALLMPEDTEELALTLNGKRLVPRNLLRQVLAQRNIA